MPTRNRNYSTPGYPGFHTWNNKTTNYISAGSSGTCQDVVGNPMGENPFNLISKEVTGGRVHGKYKNLGISGIADYPASCVRSYGGSHLSVPDTFRNVPTAIAAQHPGEPLVDLPVFIVELKDIPEMYKHAFRRAKALSNAAKSKSLRGVRKYLQNPRNPSEDWLNYNFGWAPLLSDLIKLSGLAADMQKRAQMLRNNSRVIKRRTNLGSSSSTVVSNTAAYDSTITSWWGSSRKTTTLDKWVVSHWKQDPTYLTASLFSQQAQLMRAALGLEFSISQAWELMPWSWLSDWFLEIGSVIKIRSNRAGITFKNASVMSHYQTEEAITPRTPAPFGLNGEPAYFRYEQKVRTPTQPTILSGFVNIYSSGQLATLASLAVTRIR